MDNSALPMSQNITMGARQAPNLSQDKPTIFYNETVYLPQQCSQLLGFPAEVTTSHMEILKRINTFLETGGKNQVLEKTFQELKQTARQQVVFYQSFSFLREKVEVREGGRLKAQGILCKCLETTSDGFLRLCFDQERLELPFSGFFDGKYSITLPPKLEDIPASVAPSAYGGDAGISTFGSRSAPES